MKSATGSARGYLRLKNIGLEGFPSIPVYSICFSPFELILSHFVTVVFGLANRSDHNPKVSSLNLAALRDIRIYSKSATFGHPKIKFGALTLFTPLRWIIGDGLARDLCLTGRKIDAKEAYRIRLVSEIVDVQALLNHAIKIGAMIMEAPLETIQTI